MAKTYVKKGTVGVDNEYLLKLLATYNGEITLINEIVTRLELVFREINYIEFKKSSSSLVDGVEHEYRSELSVQFYGKPELAVQMVERLQKMFPQITQLEFTGLGITGEPVPFSRLTDNAVEYASRAPKPVTTEYKAKVLPWKPRSPLTEVKSA